MYVRYKGHKKDHHCCPPFTRVEYRFDGPGDVVEVTNSRDFKLMTEDYPQTYEEVADPQGNPIVEEVEGDDAPPPPPTDSSKPATEGTGEGAGAGEGDGGAGDGKAPKKNGNGHKKK